jgi:hypothetical protein
MVKSIIESKSFDEGKFMSIAVTVELPESVAEKLGISKKDLSRAALEAIALEGYRSDRLTSFQVREMLGFETGLELDAFLKAHRIDLEYTFEDLERDQVTLDRLLKK